MLSMWNDGLGRTAVKVIAEAKLVSVDFIVVLDGGCAMDRSAAISRAKEIQIA